MGFDDDDDPPPFFHHKNKYDLNSKIMITAIISLSIVVFFVTLLHIYARYVLRRQARRRVALQQVTIIPSATLQVEPPKTGLDPSIIASIPVFIYKDIQNNSIECTVCLSVLENGETVRTLPNCKHIFHVECIDKWFGSHSTCPICRTEAEPRLLLPEPREGIMGFTTTPSAPPMEGGNSVSVEGICTDCGLTQPSTSSSAKISGSSSRLSSFRRMISRERSSRRLQVQVCGVEDGVNDLERQ